jgi:hypothetical protein
MAFRQLGERETGVDSWGHAAARAWPDLVALPGF